MRADVAVDSSDRVWIAWEEGPANWAKDSGYRNPKHRINLRPGGSRIYGPDTPADPKIFRRPRLAISGSSTSRDLGMDPGRSD